MANDFCTVTQDTTRGSSDRRVPAGTRVRVMAARLDDDGLKLLVASGKGTGSRYQIRADVTDYLQETR